VKKQLRVAVHQNAPAKDAEGDRVRANVGGGINQTITRGLRQLRSMFLHHGNRAQLQRTIITDHSGKQRLHADGTAASHILRVELKTASVCREDRQETQLSP